MPRSRREAYSEEVLLAEKDRFLSAHSRELEEVVRDYIASPTPIKSTKGPSPTESGLMQTVNSFEGAVKTSFGAEHSKLRELCMYETAQLIAQTKATYGFGSTYNVYTPTWFSELDSCSHNSVRVFKWLLEEIKEKLAQRKGDNLLKLLVSSIASLPTRPQSDV